MAVVEEASSPLRAVWGQPWHERFMVLLKTDLPLHPTIGIFSAAAYALALVLRREYFVFLVKEYLSVWIVLGIALCALLISIKLAVKLAIQRQQNPWSTAMETVATLATPEVMAGALLWTALSIFMGAFTTTKTLLPTLNPFWADRLFANPDHDLFGHGAWRMLHPWLGHPAITRSIEFVYGPVWMAMTTLLPAYFCLFGRDRSLRQRFLGAYLIAWIVSGVVLACIFMSGGPAFYSDLTGHAHRFERLLRYLSFDLSNPLSAAAEQRELWALYRTQTSQVAAGILECPSMHVSMAILCAFGASRLNRALGIGAWAIAAVIAVGSIHLGWHYASSDCIAALAMVIYWWIAGRIVEGWSGAEGDIMFW